VSAVDLCIAGASEILPFRGGDGPLVGPAFRDPEVIHDGALIVSDGKIEWVGETQGLERALAGRRPARRIDTPGRVVTPGFVDCHTHIPFARGREAEFEMRIEGKSYLEIAAAGGGILSSVRHFRETSTNDLVARGREHLTAMLRGGTTSVECKSGYGLSTEHELRALEVIRALQSGPSTLVATFLGAHAIPAEHRPDPDAYVDLVVEEMLPQVARQGIARFCDVFIEEGAFSLEQGRRILTAARDCGLLLKLHVDEFHSLGGATLAAELGAVSADHLDHVSDREMRALASAGVVAVLTPGVNTFLGTAPFAPARKLVDAGVPVALATDFNPGSCMCASMETILSLACTQLRLRPIEAIAAATRNAAHACGLGDRVGRLERGFDADILVMGVEDHRTIPYHFGTSHVELVIKGGKLVHA
jgi:imidazolonepropionase